MPCSCSLEVMSLVSSSASEAGLPKIVIASNRGFCDSMASSILFN